MNRRAEMLGVQATAIGVGFEESGVSRAFHRFVTCALPHELPKVPLMTLPAVSKCLSQVLRKQREGGFDASKQDALRSSLASGEEGSFDDVWRKHKSVFENLSRLLEEERSLIVDARTESKSCDLVVEVVFVMDCTGSMGAYIEAGKKQIRQIAANVKADVENLGSSCRVRIGFVAYRDHTVHLIC